MLRTSHKDNGPNITIGSKMAGARADYFESVKLGEMVPIDTLQNNKIGILQG